MTLTHASWSQKCAAQADLVTVTAEMLRSPQAIARQDIPPWFTAPAESFLPLIDAAGISPQPSTELDDGLRKHLASLKSLFLELHRAAALLEHEEWSDEYWRLFEGAQCCPLNQASYIRRDKGAILGDLAGFYNAFGWQHNPANGERPDHLLSQLEFTGMLLAMAATATSEEQREIVLAALNQFHRVHMNDWLPSVCNQMVTATHLPYFALVSHWLWSLWETLAKVNLWPSDQPSPSILSPRLDPEDPYECGAPDVVTLQATAAPAIYRES
ncbi:MAG: molecular chaperone TorD family protein [Planctomycetales bacterium]|nr:molecular chaperone TorD family protein [Planctomycetales bacterium]